MSTPQPLPIAIVQPIADLLMATTSVPSTFSERGTNDTLKRYNWEYGPMDPGGRRASGAATPVLIGLDVTWLVYCRAETDDECFEMFRNLVSAVEVTRRGKRWTLGAVNFTDPSGESSTSGWSLEVPLTITVPIIANAAICGVDEETDREVLTTEGTVVVNE